MDDPRDNRPANAPGRGQILQFPHAAIRGEADGATKSPRAATELSTAALFALLWYSLADVLGTAAAATLLRRAAQRATAASPELAGLSIAREALEYGYRTPVSWGEPASGRPQALCDLVRELWALLVELTGPVVVARLLQVADLRDRGIVPPREPSP